MSYNSSVLTMGKFIIMCRQFGILDSKIQHTKEESPEKISQILNDILSKKMTREVSQPLEGHRWWQGEKYQDQRFRHVENLQKNQQKDYKQLTRQELSNLFKNNSQNQKEVKFSQFLSLIHNLANKMFGNFNGDIKQSYELFLTQILKIDHNEYKQYLQVSNTAFQSNEKSIFQPTQVQANMLLKQQKIEDIKKMAIKQWHKNKATQAHYQQMEQQSSHSKNTISLNQIDHKLSKPLESTYITSKRSVNQNSSSTKLTWDQLEKLNYTDFLRDNNQNFKPLDLLDDNLDVEDNFYLRKFNHRQEIDEKQSRQSKVSESLKDYGQFRNQELLLQPIPHPQYPNPAFTNLDGKAVSYRWTPRRKVGQQLQKGQYQSNISVLNELQQSGKSQVYCYQNQKIPQTYINES